MTPVRTRFTRPAAVASFALALVGSIWFLFSVEEGGQLDWFEPGTLLFAGIIAAAGVGAASTALMRDVRTAHVLAQVSSGCLLILGLVLGLAGVPVLLAGGVTLVSLIAMSRSGE